MIGEKKGHFTVQGILRIPSDMDPSEKKSLVATAWDNVPPESKPLGKVQPYPPGPGEGCRQAIIAFIKNL